MRFMFSIKSLQQAEYKMKIKKKISSIMICIMFMMNVLQVFCQYQVSLIKAEEVPGTIPTASAETAQPPAEETPDLSQTPNVQPQETNTTQEPAIQETPETPVEPVQPGETAQPAEPEVTPQPELTPTPQPEGTLRLIYTTDIHGQVVGMDYQSGKNNEKCGLEKAFTLIKEARNEVPASNSMTFDVGDSFMDFTTDFIHEREPEKLQPVYQAMMKVGYDAITLGNHDFDYGYDFIVNQLNLSNLKDICVLSNVKDSKTGENTFGKSKIIEKTIQDNQGNPLTVQVGIIGEVVPSLSSRTETYTGILKTEDIVANTEAEAEKLKEEGADIIVVLAHSGFGPEEPTDKYKNVAYALTKIPEVDVILAGHEHTFFPTAAANDVHYTLPGIDTTTSLVNGKRLLLIKEKGKAIGIADLNVAVDENNEVVLKNSTYDIRKVQKETAASPEITETMNEWGPKMEEYCGTQIGNLQDGVNWDNYAALIEDNPVIQVVQNAQIDYAADMIYNTLPEYKDYPIVSMTRYAKTGSAGGDDYANVKGKVTKGTISSLADYNKYVYLYTITGEQLKEWMEWSASIYETVGTSPYKTWDDMIIRQYVEQGGNSLLQEDALTGWGTQFTLFEGVEYVVDPMAAPRYNSAGIKINDTNRITELTYNGVPVTADQEFVFVTNKIAALTEANAGVNEQLIGKSHKLLQDVVTEYLQEKALIGDIQVQTDGNWKLKLPQDYKFVYMSGEAGEEILKNKKWYNGKLDSLGEYCYYLGKSVVESEDKDVPNLVLTTTNKVETNKDIEIVISAHDRSGIRNVQYAYGIYDEKSTVWEKEATAVSGSSITVSNNGVYSVYVEDTVGNAAVESIAITNINKEILERPVIDAYDNNDFYITGKAEPNADIYFETATGTYTSVVGVDGKYSYALPIQAAKTKISAYVQDKNGRISDKTTITVKRVGPNYPTIEPLTNTEAEIRGNLNDTDADAFVIIGNKVYVSSDLGAGYYKKSKRYNSKLQIVETDIIVDDNGEFTIDIPVQYAKTSIKIYTTDHLGRVSHSNIIEVAEEAPNRPVVYDICDKEQYLYGYVKGYPECTVVATVNGVGYQEKTDSEGRFQINIGVQKKNTKIVVCAKDSVENEIRTSYSRSVRVQSYSSMYSSYENGMIELETFTDKDTLLEGSYVEGNTMLYFNINGQVYPVQVEEDTSFSLQLNQKLAAGTNIYMVARDKNITSVLTQKVALGKPLKPKVTTNVTDQTRNVRVCAYEPCNVYLSIGSKKYLGKLKTKKVEESKYYYIVKIPKTKGGKTVTAYANNNAGNSPVIKFKVEKTEEEEKEVTTDSTDKTVKKTTKKTATKK